MKNITFIIIIFLLIPGCLNNNNNKEERKHVCLGYQLYINTTNNDYSLLLPYPVGWTNFFFDIYRKEGDFNYYEVKNQNSSVLFVQGNGSIVLQLMNDTRINPNINLSLYNKINNTIFVNCISTSQDIIKFNWAFQNDRTRYDTSSQKLDNNWQYLYVMKGFLD